MDAGKSHDHVVAEPIQRVVRTTGGDRLDRATRPTRGTVRRAAFERDGRPCASRRRASSYQPIDPPRATRSRHSSRLKSGWPGVSIRLTVTSSVATDTTADLIVMPRCCSSAGESVWVLPSSTLPTSSMTPAAYGSRSVRVVLPASTCARIPRLSVLPSKRHTLRIGHKGLLDGHERWAHLSLLGRSALLKPKHNPFDYRTQSWTISIPKPAG